MGERLDRADGLRLLREAAGQGQADAQIALADIYQRMNPPNFVEAWKWLDLAQLQGRSDAAESLHKCAIRMTPEQIAAAERMVKEFQSIVK